MVSTNSFPNLTNTPWVYGYQALCQPPQIQDEGDPGLPLSGLRRTQIDKYLNEIRGVGPGQGRYQTKSKRAGGLWEPGKALWGGCARAESGNMSKSSLHRRVGKGIPDKQNSLCDGLEVSTIGSPTSVEYGWSVLREMDKKSGLKSGQRSDRSENVTHGAMNGIFFPVKILSWLLVYIKTIILLNVACILQPC